MWGHAHATKLEGGDCPPSVSFPWDWVSYKTWSYAGGQQTPTILPVSVLQRAEVTGACSYAALHRLFCPAHHVDTCWQHSLLGFPHPSSNADRGALVVPTMIVGFLLFHCLEVFLCVPQAHDGGFMSSQCSNPSTIWLWYSVTWNLAFAQYSQTDSYIS